MLFLEVLHTDFSDPSKDEFKTKTLAFKAAPKSNVSLEHSKTAKSEWKDGKKADSCKTETKLNFTEGDVTISETFSSDKYYLSADGKALDQDGWTVKLHGGVEFKPVKGDWKVDAGTQIKSNDFGNGTRAWL